MNNQYSEEQLAEAKEAFSLFDKNRDGTIKPSDLQTVFRALGHRTTEADIQNIVQKANLNTRETIDYETFLTLIPETKTKEEEQQELINAFREADKDETGFLAPNEFITVFQRFSDELNEDDISELWQIDDDRGNIDYVKFVKMMMLE